MVNWCNNHLGIIVYIAFLILTIGAFIHVAYLAYKNRTKEDYRELRIATILVVCFTLIPFLLYKYLPSQEERDAEIANGLIANLHNENSKVRRNAAFELSWRKHPSAVVPLIDALRDEDKGVRGEVARALGEIGNPRAAAPLMDSLKDKRNRESGVSLNVAEALGKLKFTRLM